MSHFVIIIVIEKNNIREEGSTVSLTAYAAQSDYTPYTTNALTACAYTTSYIAYTA